ncbi:hypothetical protein Nepgr_027290 [Nepenthes gracilis]|uniref:Uncharacterized protein n=1 Tax=Nepenthes gracilis TaxID=150966 RepID=A0AAD3T9S2_NEPGR|nr:hypothetical protein Nepgr_027290 [Nepenthes gracilis]
MYTRHRSPGNGYRSGGMGLGMGMAASRILPDVSNRGHGVYNSDNRNSNRGFGRGHHPKPFQSTLPPPPRRGNLFLEAGRLALDYLLSQGLLPSDVLFTNGNLRSNTADFQDHFRSQGGENLNSAVEGGRSSALARLGNVTPAGVCGRRSPGDFGSRSSAREWRRFGSSRSYSSDWSRQDGKAVPWSDKPGGSASQDMESDNDNVSAPRDVKEADGEFHNSHLTDFSRVDDGLHDLQEETEKHHSSVYVDSKTKAVDDIAKGSDGLRDMKRDTASNRSIEKQTCREELGYQPCQEEADTKSNSGTDLLKFCNSAKVPTKTRSSLANRSPKADPLLVAEKSITNDTGPSEEFMESVQDNSINVSKGVALKSRAPSSSFLDSDNYEAASAQSVGDAGGLCPGHSMEQEKYTKSQPSLGGTKLSEQRLTDGLPELGSCSSVAKDKGEKRALEDEDAREGNKKAKEWLSVTLNQENFHLSNPEEKWSSSQERRSTSVGIEIEASARETSTIDPLLPEEGAGPSVEFTEEKQLFPSSFKICDLNLMEASDTTENRDDLILMYPSISAPNKGAPVNIDLSISNVSLVKGYSECGGSGKDIEVIDLESDTLHEDGSFDNSMRKMHAELTGLEIFPSHAQNLNENLHPQDGYGLMISELIGTDIPDCSSVQPEINSLHSEMSLHHGEGLLNDDDQIYMSLGEIPTSFLQVWEPPMPDYEKRF